MLQYKSLTFLAGTIGEGTIPHFLTKKERFVLMKHIYYPILPEHHNNFIMVLYLYNTVLFYCLVWISLRGALLLTFSAYF
jgi:hypothetical protein